MFNLARQPLENRVQAFTEAAGRLPNMSETVIEKDYYVVLMMDILFHHSKFAKHFAFKGGTSLSKSFNIIERLVRILISY
jgi:predicted nucleotidyltransferase component of viral defense system